MTATDDHVTLETADGVKFYFPAVSVSRIFGEENTVISLPGRTVGYDYLRFTDKFRLIGNWHDYPPGTYDGKTAFTRMKDFLNVVTTDKRKLKFTWYSTNQFTGLTETDGPHQVMVGGLNIEKNSGEGKMMAYVIDLDRVTD